MHIPLPSGGFSLCPVHVLPPHPRFLSRPACLECSHVGLKQARSQWERAAVSLCDGRSPEGEVIRAAVTSLSDLTGPHVVTADLTRAEREERRGLSICGEGETGRKGLS